MSEAVRFCFGIHIHQPVGNFNHVFAEHVDRVYRPFLERCSAAGFGPMALHVSGPLIEWLEQHEPSFLDLVGRMVADQRLELLLAGFYEPVLAALSRADRVRQVAWMSEYLKSRFGLKATGLWLTERVWEPDLVRDLAAAGVEYVLVDDRHFLTTGFTREQLHRPWATEHDGAGVMLFPIDERLRYLIPFRPPEETAAYLQALRHAGQPLAVLADDGEKFGGWPGTGEWVYEKGWLDRFFDVMGAVAREGTARLCTFGDALREVPSGGLAYLGTASYREMEGWSLPAEAARRLARLEADLGRDRLEGPDGALIRGAHWRNFLVKYPEANRMHKKMLALSAWCADRGDPTDARRAIGRAQCNDAYWHGVFGGLYLPHLRSAVWKELAHAEAVLRREEGLAVERLDLDADGHQEIWVHSSRFSAVVSPRRGGTIEEYTRFAEAVNYADVLARRVEAYHLSTGKAPEDPPSAAGAEQGAASIHQREASRGSAHRPAEDRQARGILQERILDAATTRDDFAAGRYQPLISWIAEPFTARVETHGARVEIMLAARGLAKKLVFDDDGLVLAVLSWEAPGLPAEAVFATEVSLFRPLGLTASPEPEIWRHPVATLSQSERGFSESIQGESLTLRWPVARGEAEVRFGG